MAIENNNTLVVKAIAQLAKNKGGLRNMSSVPEIKDILREKKGKMLSSNDVESTLDVLIQARYVRYRENIYKGKSYKWYGLTRTGWAMLNELMKKKAK